MNKHILFIQGGGEGGYEADKELVGHSFGASMIVKYISENSVTKKIAGIFLLATPFWHGNEDWQTGLKLQENFADKLPDEVPIFFYHCQDDEQILFTHLDHYKQKLTQATFRELKKGGHQFNYDLALVAKDIKSLEVQSFIDSQLEANGKKLQQGIRKQIMKSIDIVQLLHEWKRE